MYILSQDEIKKVCNDLNIIDSYLDDIWQDPDKVKEALGNAPFEFENILILNPMRDEIGHWFKTYKEACEYYGEQNVNKFFGKYIAHNFGYVPKEDGDVVLEDFKSANKKPDYEDNFLQIYTNYNPHELLRDLYKNKIELSDYVYNNNIYSLIIIKNKVDDDDFFAVDDNYAILIDDGFNVISTELQYKNYTENLDDIKGYIIALEDDPNPKAWEWLDKNVLRVPLYKSLGLDNTNIAHVDIEPFTLILYMNNRQGNYLSRAAIGEFLMKDSSIYDVSYIYEYGLDKSLFDSLSKESIELIKNEFNVTEDEIKQVFEGNFKENDEKLLQLSYFLLNCYALSIQTYAYNSVLNDIFNGIKEAFPDYLRKGITSINKDSIKLDISREDFDKFLDEVVEESIDWYSDIYKDDFMNLLGYYFIRDNLKVREDDSYEHFDQDTFNKIIEQKIR